MARIRTNAGMKDYILKAKFNDGKIVSYDLCCSVGESHGYKGHLNFFEVDYNGLAYDHHRAFGFTTKKAKRLSFRKGNRGYVIIEDRNGQEWLVSSVLDNGRLMQLYKAGTDGQVKKSITVYEYKDYRIVLDEDDIKG